MDRKQSDKHINKEKRRHPECHKPEDERDASKKLQISYKIGEEKRRRDSRGIKKFAYAFYSAGDFLITVNGEYQPDDHPESKMGVPCRLFAAPEKNDVFHMSHYNITKPPNNRIGRFIKVSPAAFKATNPMATGLVELKAEYRNQKMGFVFQSFNLLPRTSVLENVKLPFLYSGAPETKWNEMAIKAIESVGLTHRLHHLQ